MEMTLLLKIQNPRLNGGEKMTTKIARKKIYNNILETVGNTPMIRLNKIPKSEGIKATILVKVESFNPGGSAKDRMAIGILLDAERKGLLKPGGTIVEPTSGNTGVALAMAAAVKGYKAIFTMPDKMSREKAQLMKAFGADVVITPTNVPHDSPESYYEVARRIAKETPGAYLPCQMPCQYPNMSATSVNTCPILCAYMPCQYSNQMNPEIHYRTTGPEIWEQTSGKTNYFVAGIGTGGTISGVARFLKEKNPKVKVIGADPKGSIIAKQFYDGKYSEKDFHTYKVEGIGMDFIPPALHLKYLDDIVTVTDKESFTMARRLAREEGILCGGSSGTALCAALKIAKKLPKNKVVVVLLPDTGERYLSKLYSDEWMEQNFPNLLKCHHQISSHLDR
jgi:cystathionine beta-synthase